MRLGIMEMDLRMDSTRLASSNLLARHSRPDSDDKTVLRCRRMSRSIPLPVGPLCLSLLPRWHDSPFRGGQTITGHFRTGHSCTDVRTVTCPRTGDVLLTLSLTVTVVLSVCLSVGTAERPPSPLARSDFFRGKSLTVSPTSPAVLRPSFLLLIS